jgi:polyether ionophore transport system permease protein
MSTVLDRPHHGAHEAPPRASDLSGTLRLLRLYLRRDRIVLPLWIILLSVPLATVYVGSTEAVYPTDADRAAFAASIMASPAQRAFYGQIFNDSVGAVGIWKAGLFHVLIAVAVILTVIRHTRADEETGRTELLDSTATGRYAGLTAALLLAGGAAVLTGIIGTTGLLTLDIPATGSIAYGLALTCSGLVFTAVAAVTAQLSPSARFARGAAFGVLGAAFALRAVGDAASRAEFLTWFSPIGWSLQVRPFAGDRFWVLLLHLALLIVLTAAAYRLLARRDVGAGLFAERAGAPRAGAALTGPITLAWRLDRGSLVVWTVGLCLYGLLIGSVVHGIGDEIGNSQIARDMVSRLGGTDAMEQAFVAVAFGMLGMIASAFAISLTLRLHQEEAGSRAETVLAGAVGRTRWLASHLVFAIGGSAATLLITGVVAGLTYGASAGDITGKLPTVLGTAAVQLPAVWLLVAVTVALFGVLPRFTTAAWGVLVGFVAVYLLGSLGNSPRWLIDLEPFTHIPRLGDDFTVVPLLWLLAIDIALIAFGAIAFRRRDLR